MSDELEVGSTGEGSNEEPQDTSSEGSAPEAAPSRPGIPNQQAAQPNYFTADQAREMFQGFAQHYNSQLATMMQKLMSRGATPAQAQQQVQQVSEEIFPEDPRELNDWDVSHWMKAMKKMEAKFKKEVDDLRGWKDKTERETNERTQSDALYNKLERRVKEATANLPMFTPGPDGKVNPFVDRQLRLAIAEHVRRTRDVDRTPVAAIAKHVNDEMQRLIDSRYQAKLKGVNMPKPVGPSKGTGTSPSAPKPKTMKDAHAAFASMLKGLDN